MLVVKKSNGDIFYEGVSEADCNANMPNERDYMILPLEQYDDFIDHLISQAEIQAEIQMEP